MAAQDRRRRSSGGSGSTKWVVLGVLSVIILVATFVLGVAAGRRAILERPPRTVAEPTPKPSPVPRRSGLVEVGPEQHVPPLRDKLTFYQTLKAPLPGDARLGGPPRPADDRARTVAARGHEQPKPVRTDVITPSAVPAAARGATTDPAVARRDAAPAPRADSSAPTAPDTGAAARARAGAVSPGAEWTVQVGVFGSAQAAEGVKRQLAQRGFAAQITPVTAADGASRYRVRVGSFGSRDDAVRTADRVRTDPSLSTYVTTK